MFFVVSGTSDGHGGVSIAYFLCEVEADGTEGLNFPF